ncbi:hypothetical protein D3879_15275 [Pseudomonas cavernicola]|uniref:Uncharacterized protein n=1 Tax=Pseudomonas cavernicola TaxID=2320866 RepID=A0A418XES8_9PSED|nr:hypothetical protein D3879_15275 [Pseudomonas cavernicola]
MREQALRQLTKDKLLAITSDGPRTTARWQAAVLRAIRELMQYNETTREENQDLRIPFAKALHDIYAEQKSDAELTEMVLLMLEVETALFLGERSQAGTASGDPEFKGAE